MHPIETKKYQGYTIKIIPDEDPEDPRNWDNFGTFICWHRRYTLGDKNPFATPQEALQHFKETKAIYLPVYMYDHSGLAFSTARNYPFNDQWDAGQVGYIYCELAKALKEFSVTILTDVLTEKIKTMLTGEITTYNQYHRGDVYGYCIEDPKGKEVDSCWGFYGSEYCMNEAASAVNVIAEADRKAKIKKTKALIKNKVPLNARLQEAK